MDRRWRGTAAAHAMRLEKGELLPGEKHRACVATRLGSAFFHVPRAVPLGDTVVSPMSSVVTALELASARVLLGPATLCDAARARDEARPGSFGRRHGGLAALAVALRRQRHRPDERGVRILLKQPPVPLKMAIQTS